MQYHHDEMFVLLANFYIYLYSYLQGFCQEHQSSYIFVEAKCLIYCFGRETTCLYLDSFRISRLFLINTKYRELQEDTPEHANSLEGHKIE